MVYYGASEAKHMCGRRAQRIRKKGREEQCWKEYREPLKASPMDMSRRKPMDNEQLKGAVLNPESVLSESIMVCITMSCFEKRGEQGKKEDEE